MIRDRGVFTTLQAELSPLPWSEIVAMISSHARDQGITWIKAAHQIADATQETAP